LEPLEDAGDVLFGDAEPPIGDRDQRLVSVGPDGEAHLVVRVLQGVVAEVVEDAVEQRRVGHHVQFGRGQHLDGAARRAGTQRRRHLFGERGQLDA
jgi:hypothetical protein